MQQNSLTSFLLSMFLLAVLPVLPALAHGVSIFAYVEGDKIHAECYFADGRPVVAGKILVLDSKSGIVAEGMTDGEGKYSLTIPKRDDLTIVIDASLGHRSTFLLKQQDLGE